MKLHVPVVEFGFMEEEFEGTAEQAYERFNEIIGICRGGIGLVEREWRAALDCYLKGEGCTPETYYKMNSSQQLLITELKKSFTRMGIRGKLN